MTGRPLRSFPFEVFGGKWCFSIITQTVGTGVVNLVLLEAQSSIYLDIM
jgi:hypothetical protein